MKFEKLNKNYTKNIIISLIVIIIIGSALVLNITKAKYRTTTSINIVNGTIKYSLADFNLIALYKQKVNSDGKPLEGFDKINNISELGDDAIYKIDEGQTKCYASGSELIDGDKVNISVTADFNSLSFTNVKKQGTKCNVYFVANEKSKIQTPEQVLVGLTGKSSQTGSTSFTGPDTNDNTGKLFKGTDDFGDTYYFRGAVDDNWVQFGHASKDDADETKIWWRIIRINGNGSIRMIYTGIGDTPSSKGSLTQINGDYIFNAPNNNAYVGYYYTLGELHGNRTASIVAGQLKIWFEDNLIDEWNNGEGLIDNDTGFCGDRTVAFGNGITNNTVFAPANRLQNINSSNINLNSWKNSQTPVFTCKSADDNYTYIGAKSGNKILQYPVGLISSDEVVYAGGFGGRNNISYYLYNGQYYWTMSPSIFNGSYAYVFYIGPQGLATYSVVGTVGLRPVINLKSSTQFSGDGTIDNPYVVQNS